MAQQTRGTTLKELLLEKLFDARNESSQEAVDLMFGVISSGAEPAKVRRKPANSVLLKIARKGVDD